MRICKGCGTVLQDTNKDLAGYVPTHLFDTADYCQRCFKLIHYGEFKDQSKFIDFSKVVEDINNKNPLIIYLIDSFNIYGSLIKDYNKLFKKCLTVVVANKIDIWPKSIKDNKIINYIKQILVDKNINFDKIIPFSSLKNENIDKIYKILSNYNKKNIYVVGKINSGKSSFVNALIKYKKIDESMIATSFYPSTTLSFIKVKFDNFNLIDSPGFIDESNVYNLLNSKNLKKVINTKEIKPISMSIYNNETLFIGSSMYIKFNLDSKSNINIFGNYLIKYHKMKSADIDGKFNNIIKDPLYVPKISYETEYEDITLKTNGERKMLFIGGLCIIDLLNLKGSITIHKPINIEINLERSLFENDINK